MKSRLNFYSSQFEPKVSLISLNSLALTFVALILGCVLASSLMALNSAKLTAKNNDLRKQVTTLQATVNNSQQLITTRKPDPQLMLQLARDKSRLAQRESVLKELAKREEIKTNRFSEVLKDLDSADTNHVWLTKIAFDNRQILLEGYGTKPDAMPLWISQLSTKRSFSGVDFQQLAVQKEEKGLFFSISTAAPDKEVD
jgi:Tfp pilus assembly protein PilN